MVRCVNDVQDDVRKESFWRMKDGVLMMGTG